MKERLILTAQRLKSAVKNTVKTIKDSMPGILPGMLAVLLMAGCANPFDPPEPPALGGGDGETGAVILSLEGIGANQEARTLLPADPVFTKYSVSFTREGFTTVSDGNVPAADVKGKQFTLAAGTWNVAVSAYQTIEGKEREAASGSASLAVEAGTVKTVTVELKPSSDPAGAKGVFTYNVTLPQAEVSSASLVLKDGDTEKLKANLKTKAQDAAELAPGSYDLFLSLVKDGQTYGEYYAAHIYGGMATEFGTADEPIDLYNLMFVSETPATTAPSIVAQAGKPAIFTLTSAHAAEAEWKVYGAAAGGDAAAGVTASFDAGTRYLTLNGAEDGSHDYWVSVKDAGKDESVRLKLTLRVVTLPASITFTVGSNGVSGTDGASGSFSADVNGSPSYSTVNGLNVLTFNTSIDSEFENGDFVSLDPIAGAYMPEDNWTMELIVKSPTNGQLLSFWGPNGRNNAGSFWIEHSAGGGYWLFRVYDQSANKGVGISRPSTNAWHHVAYVRTGGTVTCYVDGVQAASSNAGNPNATFNDTANTYFANPAFAQINNCLIGLREDLQFHRFEISKSAITPSNSVAHYAAANAVLNTLNGVKTDTPTVSSAAYIKTQTQQATAAFTLTNSAAYAGSVTWKVYEGAEGETLANGVTASLSGSTLTLTHQSDIPPATYYVSVTDTAAGKLASGRLALTVLPYGTVATEKPTVSSAAGEKTSKTQALFTLTNLTSGTIMWTVYDAETNGSVVDGVTASSNGTTLTLAHESNMPVGNYWVSAIASGSTESARLGLTVSLPESITFTAGSNSVSGTTSGGGSVAATVNGSPTYAQVNSKDVITFNTSVTLNGNNLPSAGDYVSLDLLVGAYMPEDNWTMEMIVKLQSDSSTGDGSGSGYGKFLEFWGTNGRNNAGALWLENKNSNTSPLFRVYNTGSQTNGVTITRPENAKWHHWVYVREGGTLTCYVDGVQAGTATGFGDSSSTTYFENMAMANITYCLIGTQAKTHLHQFKISKSAVTPSSNASYYSDAATVVNTLNGVKTDTPVVSSAAYTKTQTQEATATFALTNSAAYAGSVTWKVYEGAEGETLANGVTASLSGSTLTLAHQSDIPPGAYYVAATDTAAGKGESGRLSLTVAAHGVEATATPTVSNTTGEKTSKTQALFTLTNLTGESITWTVYNAGTGGSVVADVTASSSGSTLTLTHAANLPVGSYWVSAIESSKTESERLELTVSLPESIAFTVGSNSVAGTTSGNRSVGATVNGSPSYEQVNGKDAIKFNTKTTFGTNVPSGGDYVSLDPIVGAYMPEDNWTLEMFVKLDSDASNSKFLEFWGSNGRNNAGALWLENKDKTNSPLFRVYNKSNETNGVTITRPENAKWHHWVYVREGGTLTCYVDGVQAGTATGFGDSGSTTYFENSAMAQITYCLIGTQENTHLHQFKISKSAITPSGNGSYYTDAAAIVASLNGTSTAGVQILPKSDAVQMAHRGGLNTPEDFTRIRSNVNSAQEPWIGGWNKLTANSRAQLSYTPSPSAKIVRGGGSREEPDPDNFSRASNDVAAAYQLALRWKISEDGAYAAKAVEILNAWADTCTKVSGDSNRTLGAGQLGYQFAVAGEMLRDYTGWAAQDFADYRQWMLDVFYSENKDFLDRHHNTYDDHYWANWDLFSLSSAIAIGILADRRDIYNHAITYLQEGAGNGRLTKAINHLHTVDGEELGQIQESGRDQGHCTLIIALIGTICQLTWNQGDDLFGYDDNRFLKGCEYVAKYNVALEEVPFTEYTREYGNKQSAAQMETHTTASPSGRGTVRPMWALPYYHYAKVKGLPASKLKYTKMGMESVAPEGGGGDYGSGGGMDQLGFGGLLYAMI